MSKCVYHTTRILKTLCIIGKITLSGGKHVIKKLVLLKCTNRHNICTVDDHTLEHMHILDNRR